MPTIPGTTAAPRGAGPLDAVLGATFFVRFAFGIAIAVFASYIAGSTTSLAAEDYGTIGLVTALASVGEFSTVLFSGLAADRWGRWAVLATGMLAAAVLTVLFAATRSPVYLGALNLGFGVASGAILAASLAIVADESGAEERGFEMGRFDARNLAGWIVGFAVGLAFLGYFPNSGLWAVFLISAAVLAAGLAFLRRVRYSPRPRQAPTGRPPAFVIGDLFRREILLVTLPWFVIYLLIGAGLVFLGSSASSAGIAPAYLALIIAIGGLLLMRTQPYFGRLSDRFGPSRLMGVGTVGFVLVMLGASLLAAYGLNPLGVALIGVGILAALAYGPAALSALAALSDSVSRATTMAIYTLLVALGMALGLVASTQLYSSLGNVGLYLFFGAVSISLVSLTSLRYVDAGRSRPGPTPRAR